EEAFKKALAPSLLVAPPPVQLLSCIEKPKPSFTPGTKYAYSNSDNIIIALMIEAATGSSYERALRREAATPFGLSATTLPSDAKLARPFVHGYDRDDAGAPEDVSEVFAAGWAWASGGIVSTPKDANEFVRRYVAGLETNSKTRARPFQFVPGSSGPARPRYQRGRTRDLPLRDALRYRLRSYGEHFRLHTVYLRDCGREAVGNGVDQREDHAQGQSGAVRRTTGALRARPLRRAHLR